MILKVEDGPKTFGEAISFREVAFQRKNGT